MELHRPAARATQITFPILNSSGVATSGATSLDSEWVAWSDTTAPGTSGNNFADMTGEATEVAATGTYTLAVAAGELPAASPYVLIRVASNLATQFILINTASRYANISGINGTAIATPITAGYMPVDVKQSIALTSMTDNSIEKALARMYFATAYLQAAVFGLSSTINLTSPTDNSVEKALARQYFATGYATVNDMWTTALTESYATDGATMTGAQALYQIWAMLAEANVTGTTLTASKLDGTTTAMTFTINDATNPTDITRAT